MKEYYTIKDIIKIDAKQSIREAFNKFGIEGTEDKIKEHYGDNFRAFRFMMECFHEIIEEELNEFI